MTLRWVTVGCVAALASLALALAGGGISDLAAQDGGEPIAFDFPIYAIACETAPESASPSSAWFPPEGCINTEGLAVSVADLEGTVLATGVTGANGWVNVTVPFDIRVVVTADETTVPAGYALVANPIETWVYTEFAGAVFVGIAVGSDEGEAAGATLTIHNRLCPSDFFGTDYYARCHDVAVSGQPFLIVGPERREAATDADGNVVFAGLADGTYRVTGGAPGEFIARTVIFCAPAANPGTEFPSALETPAEGSGFTAITLATGDDVVCDWYSIPATFRADDDGGDGVSAPTPPASAQATRVADSEVPTELPNTGAGTGVERRPLGEWPLVIVLVVLVGVAGIGSRRWRPR
jgi:hypothetical protein